MLDYGFANYDSIAIGKKGDIVAIIPVEKGKIQEAELMLERDSYVLLPKGERGNIVKDLIVPEVIDAPILAGDEVGKLEISLDGKKIDEVKLISKSSVEKANFLNILDRTLKSYLRGR